jgi:hypothetical protein
MSERTLYQLNCPKVCQVAFASLQMQVLLALPSAAQQPNRAVPASVQRSLYAPAPVEETALRARANQTRKQLGPTNPESMRALWALSMYYLKVHKYKEAERDLRYMNDAACKNPAGCPVSLNDVQKAYATALTGLRSGAPVASAPNKATLTASTSGTAAGATVPASGGTPATSSPANSGSGAGATTTTGSTVTASSGGPAAGAVPGVTKNGWRTTLTLPVSWRLDQTATDNYEAAPVSGSPQTWYVRAKVFPATGFGNLAQMVDPQPFLGKRIKFTANVRTEDIIKAQLWMRLDDKTAGVMSADNMINRPIVGTTDWGQYECVLDVPKTTQLIQCGIIITKAGCAWIKDAALEEVSPFAQTTETQTSGP